MKALVTGATGFIGSNLVRELLAQGVHVRALARPGGDRRAIEQLSVEVMEGDLLNVESLRTALEGCDALFHVAALYSYWPSGGEDIYRVNVEGTRNVLRVATEQGVKKAVYTSSSATMGLAKGEGEANEETPMDPRNLLRGYKESKYLGELEALKANMDGLPVVIVNPTAPIGPWDVKPTPTGRIVLDFLKGKMFGYLNTGLNVIHVGDVAKGHILAWEKGRPGHRYILGNRNMSLREMFAMIGSLIGKPAPRWRVPYAVALAFAYANEAILGRLLRRQPMATVNEVKLSRKHMYFSVQKARRELDLPQTPVEEAFSDAVGWFRSHGYA